MIYFNGEWIDSDKFNDAQLSNYFTIYEVIRIFKGAPVFVQDNIERLNASIERSGYQRYCGNIDLRSKVNAFIDKCGIIEGNIKYLLVFKQGLLADGTLECDEYMVQVPHRYPTAQEYSTGVPVSTLNTERVNPQIKYLNIKLRDWCNRIIEERKVYELLLINEKGQITEGSRSNIFFIKNDILYTSPDSMVLGGTARKRVLALAGCIGIKVIKEAPFIDDVSEYQAAFITGTSPLVLPISHINNIELDVNNDTLRTIMEHYFNMILEN